MSLHAEASCKHMLWGNAAHLRSTGAALTGDTAPHAQIHADYVATWQRILNQFGGTVAAGVVYSQNTRKILPPWRGGTSELTP
jgi:hypothetical protein